MVIPLSALVGSNALKEAAEEVYFTGTQFFSASPMAAAQATLLELKKSDAANQMTDYGKKLKSSLIEAADEFGYKFIVSGVPAMPYFRLAEVETKVHFSWIDECVKRGVYMLGYHNHFISTAHSEEDLETVIQVAKEAFTTLKKITRRLKECITKKGLAQSPFLLFAGRELLVIVFSFSRFHFKNFNFVIIGVATF